MKRRGEKASQRGRERGLERGREGERGGSVRSLSVEFQLLALLLAISAVPERWPAAAALTPSQPRQYGGTALRLRSHCSSKSPTSYPPLLNLMFPPQCDWQKSEVAAFLAPKKTPKKHDLWQRIRSCNTLQALRDNFYLNAQQKNRGDCV